MSFIDLEKRFFTKNNIRFKNNVVFKSSDTATLRVDNTFNTKNIIVPIDQSFINSTDFADSAKLSVVRQFFNQLSEEYIESVKNNDFNPVLVNIDEATFNKLKTASENKSLYYQELKSLPVYSGIINDDISFYKYKNFFDIQKIKSKFIIDDPFIYKKNSIKNTLYKGYNKHTRDEYLNLNFGYCNYNTVNLYSAIKNDTVLKHTNFISYANPFNDSKNTYNFYKNDFTISFKTIFREISQLNYPNCFLHIPGILNVYFVATKNNTIRIAVTTSDYTFKNILDIDEVTNSILPDDLNESKIDTTNVYVASGLNNNNLLENNWYNICIRYNKNSNTIKINVDEKEYDHTSNLTIDIKESVSDKNNFIMFGNKLNYPESFDLDIGFDILFNKTGLNVEKLSLINKDILCPDNITNTNTIDDIYSGQNPLLSPQESAINYTVKARKESFNGEFSDVRFYQKHLENSKVENLKLNYVESLNLEILNEKLEFYVPVFYLPLLTREKQILNCSVDSHLSYYCYYNAPFNSICGGLDINIGNYLTEFVKASKPNVAFEGVTGEGSFNHTTWQKRTLDKHVIPTLNPDEVAAIDESTLSDLRAGKKVFDIYNESFYSDVENYSSPNFVQKNSLVLPNDNGIPIVYFNVIKEFIENNSSLDFNLSLYKNSKNQTDYSFISCNDIIDNTRHILDVVDYSNPRHQIGDSENIVGLDNIEIVIDSINIPFGNCRDFISDSGYLKFFSNLNLYNESNTIIPVLNMSSLDVNNPISIVYNKIKDLYSFSIESNPIIRNPVSQNITLRDLEVFDNVIYTKSPLPYNDMNKDLDNSYVSIFDISKEFYNKNIEKNSLLIEDSNFLNLSRSFKIRDNGYGCLYRSDCNTKVADWNYLGHVFYNEGIVVLNNPVMSYFGVSDFNFNFKNDYEINVNEITLPLDSGIINLSQNETYNKDLRIDEAAYNAEESFVYITDINLHDENFNIVAKAKLSRPIPKKDSDRFLVKLKMDY